MRFRIITAFFLLVIASMAFASAYTQAYRYAEKDSAHNVTNVRVAVVSSETVVSVQEVFSSSGCGIQDYYIDDDSALALFNSFDNEWILSTSNNLMNLEINYMIDYDCDVVNGSYSILNKENATTTYQYGDEIIEEPRAAFISGNVIITNSSSQYERMRDSAAEKIAGNKVTLFVIIPLIAIIVIIAVIIIVLVKRQKQY